MSYAKISQVAHYVPEQIITNDNLSQIMDTNDEWIKTRTGIERRHISRNQTTSDLAAEVAKKLLVKSGLAAEELDFILIATITPDSNMPSTAARVQAAIGATNAFAMDIVAACSGFIFALATAEKFIRSGPYKKGLVIGSETLSKIVDWSDRSTAVLFGDGAGGVLLEEAEQQHFLAESIHSDGSCASSLVSGVVGLSSPFSELGENQPFLTMEGRSIFDFAVRRVSKSIKETVEKAGFSVNEIDTYLLHQANVRLLDKMAKKMGVDREKLPANMMEYGNTSAASVPILLSECVDKNLLTLGSSQKVVLCGFGGGLTWGTLIVTI
ncbi:beta-ketoacyl-ACP synthase III [Streptococcus massiliensis]|uniref:Beta-ketoacyl-[acyl-carrier-protein] synthase III n=1 Tax=Streptococcus massiliensis TaxID=313439 RepID=A0A380L044_9STRE|nr:beta-ketoacyl-ACP synthase III [Streptococcus massiliensis]SUN77173.1 3-oxoacyl-ACP synthase [Streptococcus massiliensis]